MAVAAPGQLNLNEYPSWGSRSVDCFEKLEQIGEGTYGSVFTFCFRYAISLCPFIGIAVSYFYNSSESNFWNICSNFSVFFLYVGVMWLWLSATTYVWSYYGFSYFFGRLTWELIFVYCLSFELSEILSSFVAHVRLNLLIRW